MSKIMKLIKCETIKKYVKSLFSNFNFIAIFPDMDLK